MNIREKLIHLHHCRGIGWKSIHAILKADPALQNIYNWPGEDWRKFLPLSPIQHHQFFHDLHSIDIIALIKQYNNNQISCITIMDEGYPSKLKSITDPPWVIYVKGNHSLLNDSPSLGVVGSRNPSSYGKDAIQLILPPLVQQGYVIVSGLASGIDSLAHKMTLNGKGKTIGVLGGGLFHIYPKENIQLADVMMKRGLVLSEAVPNRRAEAWMFPMRNRIISGLSNGVFIIEAKRNSGSLITAQYALEQGRDVFALPGNITSELSEGTNKMIQDGAKLVMEASDISDEIFSLNYL
ncbi:DNA-processing protein DprA [Peribacillus sp. SCS-155]|uniref:DNA-processing protein DprA n=1 Tax=Peribacillus sedimenti TaxID=3115297 RepID=UPI003906088B